mgnify:CR=1 FL=1
MASRKPSSYQVSASAKRIHFDVRTLAPSAQAFDFPVATVRQRAQFKLPQRGLAQLKLLGHNIQRRKLGRRLLVAALRGLLAFGFLPSGGRGGLRYREGQP